MIDHHQSETEPALRHTAEDVQKAQSAIRALIGARADKAWTITEIQRELPGWSGTLVSLGLFGLEEVGEVEIGDDLLVRAS